MSDNLARGAGITSECDLGPGGCMPPLHTLGCLARKRAAHPPLPSDVAELVKRGEEVKRTQKISPGYIGTSDKACAFVDDALSEIARLFRALARAEERLKKKSSEEACEVCGNTEPFGCRHWAR